MTRFITCVYYSTGGQFWAFVSLARSIVAFVGAEGRDLTRSQFSLTYRFLLIENNFHIKID